MTFTERVWNTLVMLAETAIITYHFSVVDNHIKRMLPSSPTSRELLREMEIVLVHSHWFIDYPKLMPPHVQYIGCLQCGPPSPLTGDLERWASGAENGLVVFSLGYTGYEANTVPAHVMGAFVNAFARLPQRVLLRFNAAKLDHIPKNVKVVEWFPQHDLLAHPNTRLFVTHCGQNGLNEAVYHGVPIVALPIFADQGDNARRVVDHGLGLVIDKDSINEVVVFDSVSEVLNNTRYRETAKRFSSLWQEEGESGAEKGARWIERIHRYGRLTHLRMPGAHLSFSQYFAIDVALFLAVMALAPWCILYWFCCYRRHKKVKQE